MKLLNRKESKRVLGIINAQFGSSYEPEDILFLSGDDVYVVSRLVLETLQERWRVNELGLYLGELKGEHVRLSIEGAQLIGKSATKNTLEIDEEKMRAWLAGSDLELDAPDSEFSIIRCGNDILGCGKVKGGKLLNFVPKARRVAVI